MHDACGADHGHGALLAVDAAIEAVVGAAAPLPPERVALHEAHGRVLAEEVASDLDLPPFDRVAMDGWAVRSSDVVEPPTSLKVIGQVNAGRVFAGQVAAGQAVRVMTGAPLPAGCDAVQPLERGREEAGRVLVYDAVAAGQHVAPRGEDLRAGVVALRAGAVVGPTEIALLASLGRAQVSVHGRPSAAVVSTGDELVEVEESVSPGRIRNSNGPMLASLARAAGCDPVSHAVAPDDEASLRRALEHGLHSNLLLVSGGVSKGDKDLVGATLTGLGVELRFHGIDMQPGKPAWFGRRGACLVFGLPGNPMSAFTTATLLVAPAIRKMRGLVDAAPRWIRVPLLEGFTRRASRPGYLPCRVERGASGLTCRALPFHGSGDLVTVTRANATWRAPADTSVFRKGDTVDVLLHPDWLER